MKLLLLENDHVTTESVRRGLTEAGHTVDVVATADDGLHLAFGDRDGLGQRNAGPVDSGDLAAFALLRRTAVGGDGCAADGRGRNKRRRRQTDNECLAGDLGSPSAQQRA